MKTAMQELLLKLEQKYLKFIKNLKFQAYISPLVWELLPSIVLSNGEYTFRLQIGIFRFFIEICYIKKETSFK
jgi:hypothetical protein